MVLPIQPIKPGPPPASPLAGKKAVVGSGSGSDAKKTIKALAAESGLSKDIAKVKSQQKVLQDEDFPALDTPKIAATTVTPAVAPTAPSKAASGKASGGSKKNAEKVADKDREKASAHSSRTNTPKPEARVNDKRPVPGILNIAAATKAAAQAKNTEQSATTERSAQEKDSAFPALPTLSSAPVASPLTRAAPKTLRVVSTPKAETPQTPASGVPVSATASVRSAAAAAFRPDTPASEMISDSASIISASISASRTNSPPPSKVGSAPVRATTKSQQRKQRKEALKKDSETIAAQPLKPELNVEIAPIVGRKKKQKKEKEKEKARDRPKEKEKPVSLNATPTASRPETPIANPPSAVVKEAKEVKDESSTYRSTANETTTLTEDSARQHKRRIDDLRGKGECGSRSDSLANSTPRSLPTPASILKELQDAGLVSDNLDDLPFFKPLNPQADKPRADINNNNIISRNPTTASNAIVSAEDQATLLTGKPVRKTVDGVRVLLTPNGDFVKNLSDEEEDRFLQLQEELAQSSANPAAFVSSRHEAGGGFSLIKGRAVPNGPPGYFPQSPSSFTIDPGNKIQREEALTYINQYVLPRLNLNARDMSFPKGMAGEWTGPGGQHSVDARGASAAANLSSLAPWMYGAGGASPHDGNDTAAPELSYPGPVGSSFLGDAASYLDGNPKEPPPPHIQSTVEELSHLAQTAFSTAAAAAAVRTAAMNASNRSISAAAAAGGDVAGGGGGLGTAPGSFGNVPLMTLEDAEQALAVARKEAEKLEKSFNQFIRKNRKLLTMVSGGGGGNGGGH